MKFILFIHLFFTFFEKKTAEGNLISNLEIVLWTISLTLILASMLKGIQDNLVRTVRS